MAQWGAQGAPGAQGAHLGRERELPGSSQPVESCLQGQAQQCCAVSSYIHCRACRCARPISGGVSWTGTGLGCVGKMQACAQPAPRVGVVAGRQLRRSTRHCQSTHLALPGAPRLNSCCHHRLTHIRCSAAGQVSHQGRGPGKGGATRRQMRASARCAPLTPPHAACRAHQIERAGSRSTAAGWRIRWMGRGLQPRGSNRAARRSPQVGARRPGGWICAPPPSGCPQN